MDEFIVGKLCRIPIDFGDRQDISVVDLLGESGYCLIPDAITTEAIETHLRAHPALVESWLSYSENQRCSPSYFLIVPRDPTSTDPCTLGYHADAGATNAPEVISDRFEACAAFIKALAEAWRTDFPPKPISD
jgi:hypothetical protein